MTDLIKPISPEHAATVAKAAAAPANASADLPRIAPPAGPCAMVLFGAGGDLTKRLVTPALYNLACTRLLPENFVILGVDRNEGSDEAWRKSLTDMIQSFVGGTGEFDPSQIDQDRWSWLTDRMFYLQGDIEDPKTYTAIGDKLTGFEQSHQTGGSALFYLAVADRFFGTVVDRLGEAKLVETRTDDPNAPWRRVVIEKPFGHDLDSAKALNARILKSLREDQIYRIDHFLGKETVQNIMTFRFANGLFEPIWNRDHIDHVADHGGRDGRCRGSGQVLRGHRRVARHGAEPCLPTPGHDRHGAAGLLRGRCDPLEEGRCLPIHQGGRAEIRGPGPIRRRHRDGQGRGRLPGRAQRRPAVQYRDLRGHAARHR